MPSLSSQPAERSKRLIRSELLRRGLPSSSSAESTSWIEVKARLYVVNSRQLLLEIRGEDVYERVELHTNSTAFQTTLIEHHLSFEILSSSRILHLAAASLEACAAWVAVVNDSVMQYAAYPPEPLFWETLNREVGLEYAVTFRERRSLGVCIGKVGQLVAVESSHNSEIRAGSVVFAINGMRSEREGVVLLTAPSVLRRVRLRQALRPHHEASARVDRPPHPQPHRGP